MISKSYEKDLRRCVSGVMVAILRELWVRVGATLFDERIGSLSIARRGALSFVSNRSNPEQNDSNIQQIWHSRWELCSRNTSLETPLW